jgi:hypothetical protein
MAGGAFTQLDVFESKFPSFCSSRYCSSVKSSMPMAAGEATKRLKEELRKFAMANPSVGGEEGGKREEWSDWEKRPTSAEASAYARFGVTSRRDLPSLDYPEILREQAGMASETASKEAMA